MKHMCWRVAAVLLCLLMLPGSLSVGAAPIDTSRRCTLTLTYAKGERSFGGLTVDLYRVAQMTGEGAFQAVAPFDKYPIELVNITSQAEWNEIAATLRGYTQADGLEPTHTQTTDDSGNAVFKDIEVGLYLVGGIQTQTDEAVYTFYDFMIVLPGVGDDEWLYDVTARPKSEQREPTLQPKTYTVMKLWKDDGENRPASVTVDILKDGVLDQTVTLNADNDWTYTFTCPDGKSRWSVVERNIPEGYTVRATERDTVFTLVNTRNDPPPVTPDTGVTFPYGYAVAALCLSGLLVVVLGVGLRRKDDAGEK